jgi:LacI family sucrose operon transcriptional repressor
VTHLNISEIAKLAGVSRATVSRYFNDGYISEDKREAIKRVVEETGYRPSRQAQMLRMKKTGMIGVIVPKIASASIGKVVEGILSVLNEKGYEMLLAVTQNDVAKELEYLDTFDEKQVDGIILVATIFSSEYKRALKKITVPVVIAGQYLKGYCCVYHDDYNATYDLTKYILSLGRKNLGYIGAIMQDKAVGGERYKGYCNAVEKYGQPNMSQQFEIAEFNSNSAYEKTELLISKYSELDAIICATDTMASGVIRCLRDNNITVPDKILVAGQGDSEISKVTTPPLVTVRYSYEKSGQIAVDMLLKLLENGENEVSEIKLGYTIVNN